MRRRLNPLGHQMSLRKAYLFGLLSLALIPQTVFAQAVVDDVLTSDPSGSVYGATMPIGLPGGYFWARGDFGERPGVEGNYFSTGAFAPIQLFGPEQFFFAESQLWVDEETQIGGDVGGGVRWVFDGFSVGTNSFITWDKTLQGSSNRRFSFGGEVLTEYLEVSANGYIPWNDNPGRVGPVLRTNDAFFTNNNLAFRNFQMAEQQMLGADIEAGSTIPTMEWISAYGGAYFWDADMGQDVTGVSGRIRFDLTSALLDVSVQDDDLFGTTVNVGGELRLGGGPLEFTPRYKTLQNKIYDRVRKRSRIAVQMVRVEDQELAINPDTGLPFRFIHVDNTAGPGGTGTVENRFNNLALAAGPNGEFILVYRGTTSRTNPLNGSTGLPLDNNQIVLGEGTPFLLQTANRLDPVSLPGFDGTGTNPFVTADPGANVFTLANNNQIHGLNIISQVGGNAIAGHSIQDFLIRNINQDILPGQTTGGGGGIFLQDATGRGRIEEFSYRGDNVITAQAGIAIQNSDTAQLDLVLRDVPFLEGGQYGIDLVADNSTINALIDDVHTSANGTGIRLDARDDGTLAATLTNSSFDNSVGGLPETGEGISIGGSNQGDVRLSALNTTVDNANRDAVRVNLNNQAVGNVVFSQSSLTGAGDDALHAIVDNRSTLNFSLTQTPGTAATGSGIELIVDNESMVVGTVTDSDFSGAVSGDGIHGRLDNASVLMLSTTNSTFGNAGNDGLFVDADGGSTFGGSFTDGSFANAGGDGVEILLNGSGANLVLDGTDASNAIGGSGFKFESLAGSNLVANLVNGISLDNAAFNAIQGNVGLGSTALVSGDGTSGANAGADAVNLLVQGGTLEMQLTAPGSFAGANGDGLHLEAADNGSAIVNVTGGPIDFSGATNNGLFARSSNDSSVGIDLSSGASFDGAGNDAIRIVGQNNTAAGTGIQLQGSGVSGANHGNDGISIDADNSRAIVTLDTTGSFDATNRDDGIQLNGTNGANIGIDIDGGSFDELGLGSGHGVNGTLLDSTAMVILGNTSFNNARGNGFSVTATRSDMMGLLTNVDLNNAGRSGIAAESHETSVVDLRLDNVSVNDAGANAIGLLTTDNSGIRLIGDQVSGDNSGMNGVAFAAQSNSEIRMTLANSTFDDPLGLGVGNGLVGQVIDSDATINLDSVSFNNAGSDGFLLTASNSNVVGTLSNLQLNNAGDTAFNIESENGSNVTITGDALSGADAGEDGIRVLSDASLTNIQLTNTGSFANAGRNGVNLILRNGSSPDFRFDLSGGATQADFSGAGQNGMNIEIDNYTGVNLPLLNLAMAGDVATLQGAADFLVDNVNFSGAQANDGFRLESTNSTFNGLVTNSNFDNAGNHAFEALLDGNAPKSTMGFISNLMRNATVDGLHLEASNGTFFEIDVIGPPGLMAGMSLGGAGGAAVNQILSGGSTIDIFVDPTEMDSGYIFDLTDGSTLTTEILASPLNSSGEAVFGIDGRLENGSVMNLRVIDSDIDNVMLDGIFVEAFTGSVFNATFDNSRVFASGRRGLALDLQGATANLEFLNGSTITDSVATNIFVLANEGLDENGILRGSDANIVFDASSSNFVNAGTDGLFLIANGTGSEIDLLFMGDASFDGAGRDGLSLNSNLGGRVNTTFMGDLSIDDAGDNAISIFGNNANATVVADFANDVSLARSGGNAIQTVVGANSRVINRLRNVSSIDDAGGDALKIEATNSFLAIELSGNNLRPMTLNNAGGSGVNATVGAGANLVLRLEDFEIRNAQQDGVRLNIDNARLSTSFLRDGVIADNNQSDSGFSGIHLNASNRAIVDSGNGQFGLDLRNLTVETSMGQPAFQQNGLRVTAESDAFVNARMANSLIQRSGSDGIFVEANGDQSLLDGALANLTFGGTDVLANRGDGVFLRAHNGTSSPGNVNSGIVFNFTSGDIAFNGNGVPLDGIGNGLDAFASGPNPAAPASNTTIVLNLNDADIHDNEEDPQTILGSDNGGTIITTTTGGDMGPVCLHAGVNGFAELNLNNVKLTPDFDTAAISLRADDGGVVRASFTNMVGATAIRDFGSQAVVFQANTGGLVEASFTNVEFTNNLLNPLAANPNDPEKPNLDVLAAFQGDVNGAGSAANINLTDVTISDHRLNGFEVDVRNGGTLNSTIRNLTLDNNQAVAGEGEFQIHVDGANSAANLDVDLLTADQSGGRGIDLLADNGATLNITQFNSVSAIGANNEGLNILVQNGSTLDPLAITNGAFDNARNGDGINIDILGNTQAVDLQLAGTSANNARRRGIDINIDAPLGGGTNIVTLDSVTARGAQGGRGLDLDVTSLSSTSGADIDLLGFSDFSNAAVSGIDINVNGALGSTATVDFADQVMADNAGATGVNVVFSGAIDSHANLDGVIARNAATRGLNIRTQGAGTRLSTLNVSNSNFDGAGGNGVSATLDRQAVPATILLNNVTANMAGGNGIDLDLSQVRGGLSSVTLTGVHADGAGGIGLDLSAFGMVAGDSVLATVNGDSSFNMAGSDGIRMAFDGIGSTADVVIEDTDAAGAGGRGLWIDGTRETELGSVSVTTTDGLSNDFSGAGSDGVLIDIDTQNQPANVNLVDLNADSSGGRGVAIQLQNVTGGQSIVNLSNVFAQNAGNGDGLDLDVTGLGGTDSVDIDLTNTNFSGANGDAVNINLDGAPGSIATVDINGLSASNADDDGIDLALANGITVTVNTLDIIAQNNEENGFKTTVTGGAVLTDFSADNLNFSNNGTSGAGFDGVDVLVDGAGSEATFNFTNLTVDNSTGRGLDLDVTNNGTLTFNVTGGSFSNSGLQGLDINVGTRDEFGTPAVAMLPGTFNGTFTGVINVLNSGQFPTTTADGINVDVTGTGSVADITFGNVTSSGSDEDGFDIDVTNGAIALFTFEGASASNNAGIGFDFLADGANTTAALTMLETVSATNTFNNNQGGPGLQVNLTNGVTIPDLIINASASGNAGDGIRVVADDATGVTIGNFDVAGAQANNNQGNGLFIDLNSVIGVNQFGLTNATFTGNSGDQVFARFQNMILNSISLTDVDVTGAAGSGDGIEINLIDSLVTGEFGVSRMRAANNGERGLNLVVDETLGANGGIGDGQTAGISVGFITESEFTANGLAGARLNFGGDSVGDFDVFDNIVGFHNNQGIGLNIEVQDNSVFTIEQQNSQDPSTDSFYNNRMANNGSFGFLLNASEPDDINPLDVDGIGPTYRLDLGDDLRNPNVLTANGNAAMAVWGQNDSTGTFEISNSILTNTSVGGVANFFGDGLAIRLEDQSVLTNLILDGSVAGLNLNNNAGSGLVTSVNESGRLGTSSRMLVVNTTIEGNGRHGIRRRTHPMPACTVPTRC